MPRISPYGTWTSPISAADVAAAGGGAQWLDVVDGEAWWAEARPAEGGRLALVRADGTEMLPAPWNARNRVHEYGGRPWLVIGRSLYFTHWDDQRVYVRDLDSGDVSPVTPEPGVRQGVRYGDLRRGTSGEVWAVRETSTGPRRTDIRRDLVAFAHSEIRSLAASHHFLTAPQLSPDGRHAAWLGWDHPAMPWDETELCVAEVRLDGSFGPHRVLAGGAGVSVCQLEWESPSALLALADPEGWWNLHRITLDGTSTALAPAGKELGGALWKIGSRWFTPLGEGRYAVLDSGRLAVLDEHARTVTGVAPELTEWAAALAPYGDGVAGIASGPDRESAVVRVDFASGEVTPVVTSAEVPPAAYLPVPQERVFPGPDGERIHAYLYPPANADFAGPDGELPPYVVHVHGGPTGRNYPTLDMDFAYFTSRGIGVVAVNYGGSTGYGRAYRERLREEWGVVDVRDCVVVARALVAEGLADPARLAIRGGSAGGFTSAAAMTMDRTFGAGTVKYPILDLAGWTGEGGETHDFESRYLDGLIGPMPRARERYVERSPLTHAHALAGPVLFLQGLDDQICPPDQADRFVKSLRGKGIPYAYLTFDGEQHGFRKAATMITALEAELSFYGQVFGFDTPGVPKLELQR
ncbi:prolyl oligopeptidase family serine peptidase [Amycolatopsis acidiphila]|uniref:S9 family peptidase n=1 Tax=Amycolatopsis acidiphila TaxID=715473 RepID=A0A558AAS9_9PSEU|nr:prolyl oligopeptidase family serine peptidase [Amycolatopsis acidiphila]TVT21366.1 S9 family peptidase [Amycolatopsis acidiphila]UIJ63586.1 prolyl oligopeptidase family serine peptidase [Amycolatopsis acidiphila]GHG68094.1 acyl-peptide hydrolase [Amycolatopsis acidiphila]